jgi:hypothetical protein
VNRGISTFVMVAGGWSRMVTNRVYAAAASPDTGAASTVTVSGVNGCSAVIRGAVITTVASPFASVSVVVVLSAAGADVPDVIADQRSATSFWGRPAVSRTVAVTKDCETPSCGSISGLALSPIDVPNSDGPLRLGTSCFDTVQPAAPITATAIPARAT